MPGFTEAGVSSALLERQRYTEGIGTTDCVQPIYTYELRLARDRSPTSVRSSIIMLLWQHAAEACAGMDPDESTVMDCDIL